MPKRSEDKPTLIFGRVEAWVGGGGGDDNNETRKTKQTITSIRTSIFFSYSNKYGHYMLNVIKTYAWIGGQSNF